MTDRPFEPATSSLGWYGGDTNDPTPVRELYGVFARPRNEADVDAEPLAAISWSGLGPGEVALGEGRVLLAGLGGELDLLFAAPFGDDRVAYAVLPNGGGGWVLDRARTGCSWSATRRSPWTSSSTG